MISRGLMLQVSLMHCHVYKTSDTGSSVKVSRRRPYSHTGALCGLGIVTWKDEIDLCMDI